MCLKCAYKGCKKPINQPIGNINRAKSRGLKLYCDRTCAGLGRRKHKTINQKKKEKAKYDKEYRAKNHERLAKRKQAYEKTPAGRAMQKRNRDKFKKYHLEYCRTPWYRKWKKQYDLKYRAKKDGGQYWESVLLLKSLKKEINNREAKQSNNLINKTQKRKRLCKQTRRLSRRR